MSRRCRVLLVLLALCGVSRRLPAANGPLPAGTPAQRLAALRREAASANPPSPPVLSDRLTEIADAFLASDPEQAIELLSEALGADPDNGAALAKIILAYLQHDDVEFADFYLEEATSSPGRRNESPGPYRAIGDAFAARNRMAEAVSAWDYFRRLGGSDPAVDARLGRGRGELSIRSPQRLRESEGLSLYVDASISEEVAEQVERHLIEEMKVLEKFFGSPTPVGSHVVILYEGRGYFSLVSVPNWVSGIFDGKIRVSVASPPRWTPELAGVLSHELAHSFLRAVSHGRAPAWLHEGLGEWFQGQRFPLGELREWFLRHDILTPDEMDGVLSRRTDRDETRNVYLEALGLTEYLIDERGSGTMACLVEDLAGGRSMEDALIRETGGSSRDLISRWKRSIGITRASDKAAAAAKGRR